MRREDERSLLGNKKIRLQIQVVLLQTFDFAAKHDGIEDYTIADDILNIGAENSGRNLVQYVLDTVKF